jgi:hypothetical protein
VVVVVYVLQVEVLLEEFLDSLEAQEEINTNSSTHIINNNKEGWSLQEEEVQVGLHHHPVVLQDPLG